jgi:hypothetical protein
MVLAIRQWLYGVATPALAFVSLFAGFYALLFSTSRADWMLIFAAAVATIAGATAAFVHRKQRPNLALGLVTAPVLVLATTLLLR